MISCSLLLLSFLPTALSVSIPADLKPWLVTAVGAGTPSGRSNNPPYSSLRISISDPNTIPLGPTRYSTMTSFPPSNATCFLKWNAFNGEDPFAKFGAGAAIPCWSDNFSAGRWSMQLLSQNVTGYGPSATRDFRVRYELEESMILDDGIVTMTFAGTVGFAVGQELQLVCGASGVCSTGLKQERVPVQVVQKGQVDLFKWD
ncbi:hypothetical protein QBC43DRAFT_328595 [Cladorrhinum sp. PSN259]|nr:hypothetical protein QBC43DRAFT_328595 [Cladorrhinum sp. PSN259]